MDMKELGGFICDALIAKDIHVVLSGGSCVEIYSRGEYSSFDLDLINQYLSFLDTFNSVKNYF